MGWAERSASELEYEVRRHTPLRRIELFAEAAFWVGSQLPSRQKDFERHNGLAPGFCFKANILLSLTEITALGFLGLYGRDIADRLATSEPGPITNALIGIGVGYSGIQSTASALNTAARTSIYFATGAVSQSFWGARSIPAFADKAMKLTGFDIVEAAHAARASLYDLVESNSFTRWLNTDMRLEHACRPPRYGPVLFEPQVKKYVASVRRSLNR